LRRRTSSFDQGRLAGAFFVRATALAMCSPVWCVSDANRVLHELESRATLANHYGHLAKIFEWRSAGDASARPTKSISGIGVSTCATKSASPLVFPGVPSLLKLLFHGDVFARTCRDVVRVASLRAGRGLWPGRPRHSSPPAQRDPIVQRDNRESFRLRRQVVAGLHLDREQSAGFRARGSESGRSTLRISPSAISRKRWAQNSVCGPVKQLVALACPFR
jgi:hypothetical protein